jgi:Cdc6-like AAA superfamily ATPase
MTQYLTESFNYFFDNYAKAKKEAFANNPVRNYIRYTIPENFYKTGIIDRDKYLITGSVGKGNWATVPWLGIFNTAITSSATKGVYIVYLLSSDGSSLYLTFNQGCTEIRDANTKKETIKILRKNALELVSILDNHNFNSDENINLGYDLTELAEMYQKGTIFYKKYSRQNLPSEEQLRADLKDMINIYEEYYHKKFYKTGEPLVQPAKKETNMENIILYGPPGTGKTYKMQNEYINKIAAENRFVTTFHQSFSYEEFVEGLKPSVLKEKPEVVVYRIEKGIFFNACERAAKLAGYKDLEECIKADDRKQKMEEALNDKKIVLLCIDEINRANVSAVFGDLISLIEPSKRIGAKNEMKVKLPYSKKEFGVPANLLIIGTMNTADRSIQLLDSALRRRFKFEELMPDYRTIDNLKARNILEVINARIRSLLDKDHQIGHSYFIDAKDEFDIFNALKDCVIPLLEEYLYNDAQKIRQILNEEGEDDYFFYKKDAAAMKELDNMKLDFDNEKEIFMLNPVLAEVNDAAEAARFIAHIV